MDESTSESQAPKPGLASHDISISNIQALLKASDDTQRFVGLALLKSVLNNNPQLREDQDTIKNLWESLSSKFLDRLLRTGLKPFKKDSKDMLDLAVTIMHTFVVLLPEKARQDPKFTGKIPRLVEAVLYSSEETTVNLLQLLQALVNSQPGAQVFVLLQDLSSLAEIAPTHPIVLDILLLAWLNAMTVAESKSSLALQVDITITRLVASFRNTDAVTLLEFLGAFLRQATPDILPSQPKWIDTVVTSIQKLVVSRPTPEARSAYTNAAANLLQAYPSQAAQLLFNDKRGEEKPLAYLLVNLLLIDIRSSAPRLIEKLNDPEYPSLSRRLSSAFEVVCLFIGHLVRSLEDESMETLVMSPDNLLKLRKSISETMSVTAEYLRDRWDASVAGAMGLHPDARAGSAQTSMGTRHTLAWDSMKNDADEDPFILSAIRALALWLREDENETLRKEATGLTDMFLDLYKTSSPETLDFRTSVLVAFEATVTLDSGRELLLSHEGWQIFTKDLVSVMQGSNQAPEQDLSRGIEIVRVLLSIAEQEHGGVVENWLDLVTTVAAWNIPTGAQYPVSREFQVAVLQLCCTILASANPGMRRRYSHSISAIAGIANQLGNQIPPQDPLRDAIQDVLATLESLRQG